MLGALGPAADTSSLDWTSGQEGGDRLRPTTEAPVLNGTTAEHPLVGRSNLSARDSATPVLATRVADDVGLRKIGSSVGGEDLHGLASISSGAPAAARNLESWQEGGPVNFVSVLVELVLLVHPRVKPPARPVGRV